MQSHTLTPEVGEPIRLTSWRLIRHARRGTYHLVGLIGDQPHVTSQVVGLDQIETGLATIASGQTYLLSPDRKPRSQTGSALRAYCRERGLPVDFTDESALVSNPDLDFGALLASVYQTPHVILLNGLSVTGKTTIGHWLSRFYQARLIAHREVRAIASHMKRHENAPPMDALRYARVWRMREEIARGTDDAYIWTDIFVRDREDDEFWLGQLIGVAAVHKARIIAVNLTVEEGVRLNRIAAAGNDFAEQRIEILPDQVLVDADTYAQFGIPSITYDTTKFDAVHGAAELVGQINEALRAVRQTSSADEHAASGEP